jgi:hypothetical protein
METNREMKKRVLGLVKGWQVTGVIVKYNGIILNRLLKEKHFVYHYEK